MELCRTAFDLLNRSHSLRKHTFTGHGKTPVVALAVETSHLLRSLTAPINQNQKTGSSGWTVESRRRSATEFQTSGQSEQEEKRNCRQAIHGASLDPTVCRLSFSPRPYSVSAVCRRTALILILSDHAFAPRFDIVVCSSAGTRSSSPPNGHGQQTGILYCTCCINVHVRGR